MMSSRPPTTWSPTQATINRLLLGVFICLIIPFSALATTEIPGLSGTITPPYHVATLLNGILLGMLLVLGCTHIHKGIYEKNRASLYFCGYLICVLLLLQPGLLLLSHTGAGVFERTIAALGCLALIFLFRYGSLLLPLDNTPSVDGRTLKMVQLVLLISGLLSPLLSLKYAIILLLVAAISSLLLLILMSGYLALQKNKHAGLLNAGLVLLFIGVITTSLAVFGYIPLNEATALPLQIGLLAQLMTAVLLQLQQTSHFHQQWSHAKQQARTQEKQNQQLIQEASEAQHELENSIEERTFELEVTLRELQESNRQLELQSTIDNLTGVKNRGFFDKRYAAELRVSRRQQTPVALLMIDIDHFKRVNDNHGHLIGDQTLRQTAERIASLLKRPTDNICRYGGEEFALLLPNTDGAGAVSLAESIRTVIEQINIQLPHNEQLSITASIGVASMIITADHHPNDLLSAADQALYQAKDSGRNQVVQAKNNQLSNESA